MGSTVTQGEEHPQPEVVAKRGYAPLIDRVTLDVHSTFQKNRLLGTQGANCRV
jgi:hypothetical protein